MATAPDAAVRRKLLEEIERTMAQADRAGTGAPPAPADSSAAAAAAAAAFRASLMDMRAALRDAARARAGSWAER